MFLATQTNGFLRCQNVMTLLIVAIIAIAISVADLKAQSIIPYAKNPKYWQFKGKPLMLLGANKTDSPYLLPDQRSYYDSLAMTGGNFTRFVVKQRLMPGLVELFPFKKLENDKYDLDQWDDEYWQRFEDGIKMTRDRNIILQMELWDRFDVGSETHYNISPWRPQNNITYTDQESGLPNEWKGGDAVIDKHPFFASLPSLDNNTFLLKLQEKYVDKVLSITVKYDHILYVITNESTLNLEWSEHWAQYIQKKADSANKRVLISEMPWTINEKFPFDWQQTSLKDPNKWISHVINRTDLYSFCAFQFQPILKSGQDHYDRIVEVYNEVQNYAGGPRPVNAVKIFARDKIIFGGSESNAQTRFWRPLMAGWAAVSLHRTYPDSGYLGFSENGQKNLSAARKFCDAIMPWGCTPRQDLLLSRESDEAYLLANPGKAYGVYFPSSGMVELNMTDISKSNYYIQWISIETGDFYGDTEQVKSRKSKISIQTPDSGSNAGWAAVIVQNRRVIKK